MCFLPHTRVLYLSHPHKIRRQHHNIFLHYCLTLTVMEEDVVVLTLEFERVGKVKYPGVGKKTHSVFEGLFFFTMCISNPNFVKFRRSREMPVSNWCIDLKTKAPSWT